MSQATSPADGPATLESIESRIERIERTMARLDAVLDEIPNVVAAAVDSADEAARSAATRGVDIHARIEAAGPLVEQLTDPATMHRLERLLGHMHVLEASVAQLAAMPDMVAAAVDSVDEAAGAMARRGVDLPAVSQGLADLLHLGARLVQSAEFRQLLDSDLLRPDAVGSQLDVVQALVDTAEEPPGKAGFIAIWRATRDPDVQRALDFGLRFLKRWGAALNRQSQNQLKA